MIKRIILFVLAGLLMLGVGFVYAGPGEVEIENEVELEHGTEMEQCPGGGRIFTGVPTLTPPAAGSSMATVTVDMRNDDCVAKVEKTEGENRRINEDIHVKAEVEVRPDNKIELKDMTIVHDNNTVISDAGDDFTITCTKTIPAGTFDPVTNTLVGNMVVTCTATGKIKMAVDDLLLDILPHR